MSAADIHALIERALAADEIDRRRDALEWAVERWNAEVKNRPPVNIHRRTLDDTWRQVMRRFGGDPDALVGPSHDELLDYDLERERDEWQRRAERAVRDALREERDEIKHSNDLLRMQVYELTERANTLKAQVERLLDKQGKWIGEALKAK